MRLIDADEIPYKNIVIGDYHHRCVDLKVIREMPTVDAVPIKHGHWIYDKDTGWLCSECGHDTWEMIGDCKQTKSGAVWTERIPNYCPKCGARMDGE